MKKLLLASTMSLALMTGATFAQDAGAGSEAGGGANAGGGADAGGADAGAGGDAGAGVGADTDAGAGTDTGVDADVDAGADVGTDTGTDADIDGELDADTEVDVDAGVETEGVLGDIGSASDDFFTDSTRTEAVAPDQIMTTFSALTPEEQQIVLTQCADAVTVTGALVEICEVVVTQ
ncbi:hypothetical protein [Rhizobium sp. EC-SD404]|uniref:hypothetical protein n=1 Tax=Rhizobium sp. EC-SD404 TaxID=2038389 RepID=UPI00125703B4|nr:hypothetical protein [Rhizobium sp. EC-SD404]VVT23752.1 exported hypothetical protein [Rhizobium sp. EC-SD404]